MSSTIPHSASESAHTVQIRPGSDAHKRLFCRTLLDTFNPYKPAVIDWPPALVWPVQKSYHVVPDGK